MGSRLQSNSDSVRKRIASHTFDDEDGDEYSGSKFGGFSDYFRRKKIKLQNLDADIRSQSADKPQIFKGIVAHVNGYTQPSLNDLHTLIVQHGGGFMQYLDGKTTVTHIIASSLTPKKVVEFRRYRIVKPAWVVDSIQAGKLLPWNEYRVVDEGEKQKVLGFDSGKIMSRANNKAKGYRDQTEASWYTNQLRGSQLGEPASTPTPTGSMRSRFSRQRLPTPDDQIEKLPPSHQPQQLSFGRVQRGAEQGATRSADKLVTPPKTSPPLGPQPDDGAPLSTDDGKEDQNDDLYADPMPNKDTAYPGPVTDQDQLQQTSIPQQAPPQRNRPLTAEEHNAILLRDPKIRKSTVVDPNFLEQYYRESRLHHLSTWKADLKFQLQALANERSSSQTTKQKRPPGARRYVLHVDFDSFFAAVSLRKHPEYKDKPAVVAHGNGNGSEIASCNYPARKFGVKNGMWMKRAQELCPELKVLPYDFPAYEETSRAFYDAILATGGLVQSVSIDEALVDVSNLCIAAGGSDGKHMSEGSIYREQAKADEIARSLRDEVKMNTDCNVSVGIGGNILLAKVALRKAKPAGQYQIKPEEVLDFIGQLQVQDLPGVAWSIGGKLEEIGIKYVNDIREFSKERLVQTLGPKTGEKLWEYSRGIDKQEVGEQVVRKSVSAEVNWGVRFENQEQADEFISSLCGELQKRLLKEKVKGKQFTMKIMRRSHDAPLDPPKHLGHGKCDTYNKSLVLGVATNNKDVLTREALSILKGFGFSPGELRGIGMQMTKLEPMKNATDGSLESSQRRLQFKVNNEPKVPPKAKESVEADPIQDDPETPKKPKAATNDEHVAFGPPELNHSTPSRRPLNMLGTQFIMPSQVDPKVLAELPEDIRSKLLRQARQTSPTPATHRAQESSPSKRASFPLTALPAHSQLDPEILAALPPDVRAEVLSQYAAGATPRSPSARPKHIDQTILPQSPRKNRIIGIPAKKPIVPPVKRGRGRPPRSAMLAAAALAGAKDKSGKTLTQANFLSLKNPARDGREGSVDLSSAADGPVVEAAAVADAAVADAAAAPPPKKPSEVDGLDADFLSALPPDLREEILEDHKRKKLHASRLLLPMPKSSTDNPVAQPPKPAQRIKVPRPPRPTFTMRKLSEASDLRRAMKDWVQEFAEEGPYKEDVEALAKYLGRVVREERDLGKAVGLVRWLGFVTEEVADEEGEAGFERGKWEGAVRGVKEGVRSAARGRGLGVVAFD
ncbi:DNA repair protein [Lentithecium fluviatile CBS 122367]|uniref:DNA repair protein REV1 n=1 Tax=Lentithecium fluviatile CBS 122367 TaxID=1168545 RepID=A0A6G1IFC6_9PLEO|nr:DNA repair protein [Lentithecium fluviatile CBS 122367]